MRPAFISSLLIAAALATGMGGLSASPAQAQSPPANGQYVEAPAAGAAPAEGQPAPAPQGFRLTAPICAAAARQNDPLAQTPECQGILQAARTQQEACARAFQTGDDSVVLSTACRQAAMAR